MLFIKTRLYSPYYCLTIFCTHIVDIFPCGQMHLLHHLLKYMEWPLSSHKDYFKGRAGGNVDLFLLFSALGLNASGSHWAASNNLRWIPDGLQLLWPSPVCGHILGQKWMFLPPRSPLLTELLTEAVCPSIPGHRISPGGPSEAPGPGRVVCTRRCSPQAWAAVPREHRRQEKMWKWWLHLQVSGLPPSLSGVVRWPGRAVVLEGEDTNLVFDFDESHSDPPKVSF